VAGEHAIGTARDVLQKWSRGGAELREPDKECAPHGGTRIVEQAQERFAFR
jgi:hypothetical protein